MVKNSIFLKKDLFRKIKNNFKLKQKNYKKTKNSRNRGKILVFNRSASSNNFQLINSYNFYRGIVEQIDYDSYRNNFIARVFDIDKRKHFYNVLTYNLMPGCFIVSNFQVKINLGNRCLIKNIPTGTLLNNVEISKTVSNFNKRFFAKSAGCFCQLVQKSKTDCLIKLPSGRYKKVSSFNFATIGIISNIHYKRVRFGKAGRSRWLNQRSKVRGVAMNPVDHPHGGGEGRTSGGRHLVSPWGKIIKK